jgi:hypothetical protein
LLESNNNQNEENNINGSRWENGAPFNPEPCKNFI